MSRLTPEQKYLRKQWPKTCSCGRKYNPEDWEKLDALGTTTDDFSTAEWRNCVCGSTLLVHTEIHDLSKE